MKLSRMSVSRLQVPIIRPLKITKSLTITETMDILLEMQSDTGLTTTSTAAALPWYTGSTQGMMIEAIKYLTPHLEGAEVSEVARAHETMDRLLSGSPGAKSAIDLGLYDILGKELGVPVHTLLGGKVRERFPTHRVLRVPMMTPRQAGSAARRLLGQGIHDFEVHLGTDIDHDVSSVRAIRDAAGAGATLLVDLHGEYPIRTAIALVNRLDRYEVLVEDPANDIQGLAAVKRAVAAPVVADVPLQGMRDAREIVEAEAADMLNVKVAKVGGLMPAKAIADYANASGLDCRVDGVVGDTGVVTAAAAHLCLTVRRLGPACGVLHHLDTLKADIVRSGGVIVKDGSASVGDAPGLGVETDRGAIDRYRKPA